MTKLKILITEPKGYSDEALDILRANFNLDFGPITRVELLKVISMYDGLVVRLEHSIDKELLLEATSLKFIASPTTGLNHIDVDVAKENNINIISLKGEREFLNDIYATAEHTWCLILSIIRKLAMAFNSVSEGEWDRDKFKGSELNGKCLGILGFGRLGSKVAKYGQAFNMNVIVHDKDSQSDDGYEIVSIEELFKRADIVSIHLDYNHSTIGLVSQELISLMKPNSYLINTSRGEIVDEEFLIYSLKNNKISGAALDVLSDENIPNPEFHEVIIEHMKKYDNLIVTPHIGGATYESMDKTEVFIADKVKSLYT